MNKTLHSSSTIQVRQVINRKDRLAFVKFPWSVYKNDPNWVPPLISAQLSVLDPEKGSFYKQAEVALFLAIKGRTVLGRIAAFVNRVPNTLQEKDTGGFGFFEVVEDYSVARLLLDTACEWLRARDIKIVKGPINFNDSDNPGVLIEGAKEPPVMLEAHTPPYYQTFLEQYGMEKDHDLYAWRAMRTQVGEGLKNIPQELMRVAEVARQKTQVKLRTIRLDDWNHEVSIAHFLFNETLKHLPEHVPMTLKQFHELADQVKFLLDPDLALIAEIDGNPVGFCVAVPDINRILIHLNGRLFPFGWLKVKRLVKQIDVVSFKLMGVLDEHRRKGIDALLYLETVKSIYKKGYRWFDGSVTSENNPMINLIANRFGAEKYKVFRVYKMNL